MKEQHIDTLNQVRVALDLGMSAVSRIKDALETVTEHTYNFLDEIDNRIDTFVADHEEAELAKEAADNLEADATNTSYLDYHGMPGELKRQFMHEFIRARVSPSDSWWSEGFLNGLNYSKLANIFKRVENWNLYSKPESQTYPSIKW